MDPISSVDRVCPSSFKNKSNVGLWEHIFWQNKNNSIGTNNKPCQKQRSRLVCTHCGLTKYIVEKCYKLHDYPLGYRQNLKTKAFLVN